MADQNTRSTTRRTFLANGVTGGVIGTAGCQIRMPTWLFGDPDPPPFGPVEHGWRMAGRDAANTAHNPGATGPRTEPEVVWEITFAEPRTPRVLIDEEILVATDTETLHVFDLDAGELVWSSEIDARMQTPALGPEKVYVRTGDRELSAFDTHTGERTWIHSGTGGASAYDFRYPVVHEGVVYTADADGTVYALDTDDGTIRWQTNSELGPRVQFRPAIDDDRLYLGGEQDVAAFAVDDGPRLWKHSDASGSLVATEERIYAGGTPAVALRADGTEKWRTDPEGDSYSIPAVADGRAYVTHDKVEARDADSGEVLWTGDTRTGMRGQPVVDSGTVYVGSTYSRRLVSAVDSTDGSLLWDRSVPEAPNHLCVVDDVLLVGVATGKLLALA